MEFSELKGKTLKSITVNKDKTEIIFCLDTGEKYEMRHDQDCHESVWIDDICGELGNMLGSPIVVADCVTNEDDVQSKRGDGYGDESHTWTFYKLATKKGYVDIRWYGESNGYYSESVDFIKL